jgi:uncharacterized protein YbjT (DUF2867 family)
MKIVLFGATGMVGQGVLRECLSDPEVEHVLAVVRPGPAGELSEHEKLRVLRHEDFYDYSKITDELAGYDACLFCLGVSSAGMKQAAYERITYDLTLAAAEALLQRNPKMKFLYVSGAGTDSSEKGRSMWARVKGRTENSLMRLPSGGAYMFRPGFIQPRHGVRSKTRLYRVVYAILGPLFPLWKLIIPRWVTTTDTVGRVMVRVAKQGAPKPVLENRDINALDSSSS